MGLASGVRDSRNARLPLVDGVEVALLSTGISSADQRMPNANDLGRQTGTPCGGCRPRALPLGCASDGCHKPGARLSRRALTDPVWFFVTDWFPIYLVAKGIELRTGLIAIWIPFLGRRPGKFLWGRISGYLIKRGWSLGRARKAVVIFGGIGVTVLMPTVLPPTFTSRFLFALATFSYAAFSTMANVFPSDLFHSSVRGDGKWIERNRRRLGHDCRI